jgi:hypothetical protein
MQFKSIFLLLVMMAGTPVTTAIAQEHDYSTIVLNRQSVPDAEFGNRPAYSILMPQGWNGDGQVFWHPMLQELASPQYHIESPDGQFRLEQYPMPPMTWTTQVPQQQGTVAYYMMTWPVQDVPTYVMQTIIPQGRPQAQNVRVTGVEQLQVPPAVQQYLQQAAGAAARAGAQIQTQADYRRVRVAYTENGRQFEEAFDVMLSYRTAQMPSMTGQPSFNTQWLPMVSYSMRAPAGRLDEAMPLLSMIARSFRIDPQWFNAYAQTKAAINQSRMQASRRAAADSARAAAAAREAMSRANTDITDDMMASWRRQQEIGDRLHESGLESLHNVNTYDNPFADDDMTLPNTHNHVWVADNGATILTDNALYNPALDPQVRDNMPGNPEWRQAERQR